METMERDWLAETDAERLEVLGFERFDDETIGVVVSGGESYGWRHDCEYDIGSEIDWPLLGILIGMCRNRKIQLHSFQSNTFLITETTDKAYRLYIPRNLTERQIFDALLESLET